MKRNPRDHKAYSNRSACYAKLAAWTEGLRDAERCVELAPDFAKGYSRKAAVQFFMKDFDKALATYTAGLKHDADNEELKDGVRRCVEQINRAQRGELSEEEMAERREKGMQDPEIQMILTDPVMRQVLNDFQNDPKAARHHQQVRSIHCACMEPDPFVRAAQNAGIMAKVQKLISAGILRVG